jgi:hypothetical protein
MEILSHSYFYEDASTTFASVAGAGGRLASSVCTHAAHLPDLIASSLFAVVVARWMQTGGNTKSNTRYTEYKSALLHFVPDAQARAPIAETARTISYAFDTGGPAQCRAQGSCRRVCLQPFKPALRPRRALPGRNGRKAKSANWSEFQVSRPGGHVHGHDV